MSSTYFGSVSIQAVCYCLFAVQPSRSPLPASFHPAHTLLPCLHFSLHICMYVYVYVYVSVHVHLYVYVYAIWVCICICICILSILASYLYIGLSCYVIINVLSTSLSLSLSLPCASDLSVCLPCSCPHVPSLSFALCLSPSRHVDTMIRQHLATLIPEASADGHEVASHRESEAYSKVCCSACTQAAHEG